MKRAAILLALALAACQPQMAEPPPFHGYKSKGHTIEVMEADGAACRNQARALVGGPHAFWDIYSDCMISKGYSPG